MLSSSFSADSDQTLFQVSTDSSYADYTEILSGISEGVTEQLIVWFSQDDYLAQLAISFSASTESAFWMAQATALQSAILQGDYQIQLELRSSQEMNGAMGAYSAIGTTGQPTIYLNGDWLATATSAQITAVLLEELGHDFDQFLNNGLDSQGDEGEIFANLVQGSPYDLAALQRQDDHITLTINGTAIQAEAAVNIANPDSSTWTNLLATSEPNKAVDGGWTSNSADFVGSDAEPYLQIP